MTAAAARGRRRRAGAVVVVLLLAAAAPSALAAQDVRGWATTTVRYTELRPLRADTVPIELATATAGGGFAVDGRAVQCVPGVGCVHWLPGPVQHAATATQDLALTGWGFGVEGLSATLLARGRSRLGGALVWPRSEDAFDLILGYVQLNRGPLRARLGRQESLSGLGSTSFDGADVLAVLARGIRIQAYGGRSLARGLVEPRDEALRGLQDFLPERGVWLIGASVAAPAGPATTAELRYQREIWSDRRGLVAERASLDARSSALAPVSLSSALDYDVGMGRVGKGHLQARLPLSAGAGAAAAVEATVRRYLPYFELYTIWGFFSPVAYHEAELRGSWGRASVDAWALGAYRAYEDAQSGGFLVPASSRGWRLSGGGRWSPGPAWSVQGQYAVDLFPGAFLSSADVSLRRRLHERVAVTATATGFQQIEEFRLADGRTLGAALAVDARIGERVHLDVGAGAYRQVDGERGGAFDWSQLRGWSALRVEVGRDPALPRAGGAG